VKLTAKGDIYTCLQAYTDSAAMGAALELGLFWLLAEQPLDAPGIAQVLRIPMNRCSFWLQLLEGMGLLEQVPQGYAPSSLTRTAILDTYSQESWAYLAAEEREHFSAACDLALHIREPGPIRTAQGHTTLSYVQNLIGDPDRARRFTRMLYELHQPMAVQLGELLDMTGVRRMMDLGGGSGVMSLALLARYPHLTSVVVDIENVCIAGREIAMEHEAAGRITYHAADFVREELPGGFDLVLKCDVFVDGEALFRKLWRGLNRGGRLIIVDRFAPAETVASPAGLYWTFLDSLEDPAVELKTADQIRSQLTQAGFHLLSEDIVPNGWLAIQAGK
jgi:ubiquinone/menaquinone biosynthesis C-methylase UbiE